MKTTFLKRIFSRKTFVRLALTLVVLAALVFLFYGIETWRGERAWEAYRKQAEARGVKLRLRDFVTPEIPADQNYAAVPFITDLFGAPEKVKAAEAMLPDWNWTDGKLTDGKRPAAGKTSDGSLPNMPEWRDYLVKAKIVTEPTAEPARDIIAAFGKLPAIVQLRETSSRTACRFPTEIEKGFSMPTPHLNVLVRVEGYFQLDAEARLEIGDRAGALEDCVQLFRLSDAFGSELFVITFLVRGTVLDRVCAVIHEGLTSGSWTRDDLAALEGKLASQNLIEAYRFAMAGERAAATTEMERHSKMSLSQIRAIYAAYGVDGGIWLFPRGWFYTNILKLNELHDTILTPLSLVNGNEPEFIPQHPIIVPEFNGLDHYRYLLAKIIMRTFASIEDNMLFRQTQLSQARIACALERARLATGSYPETLESLAPSFVVPKDICDGKPMRYRRTASGYELWSVGKNRLDEGGKTNPKEKGERKQPDWLWKLELRAAK